MHVSEWQTYHTMALNKYSSLHDHNLHMSIYFIKSLCKPRNASSLVMFWLTERL